MSNQPDMVALLSAIFFIIFVIIYVPKDGRSPKFELYTPNGSRVMNFWKIDVLAYFHTFSDLQIYSFEKFHSSYHKRYQSETWPADSDTYCLSEKNKILNITVYFYFLGFLLLRGTPYFRKSWNYHISEFSVQFNIRCNLLKPSAFAIYS